jgi:hypothetical protein
MQLWPSSAHILAHSESHPAAQLAAGSHAADPPWLFAQKKSQLTSIWVVVVVEVVVVVVVGGVSQTPPTPHAPEQQSKPERQPSPPVAMHEPPRTARTRMGLDLLALVTNPLLKITYHAPVGSPARVVDDQYWAAAVGPNTGSMHGVVKGGLPHPATLVSRIVCSSAMVGNRQSQCPANPPVCVLPSELTQLPTPVAPPFSVLRKLVKAVPSGMPWTLSQRRSVGLASTHQVYVSFTQWMPGQVLSFFSQMSPVSLSVTVPSRLSTKRAMVVVVVLLVVVVVVVLVVDVLVVVVVDVLVVVGGAAHSPVGSQNPLQHCRFCVQVARFGLQLALLGSVAAALRGVVSGAPTTASARSSMGLTRDMWFLLGLAVEGGSLPPRRVRRQGRRATKPRVVRVARAQMRRSRAGVVHGRGRDPRLLDPAMSARAHAMGMVTCHEQRRDGQSVAAIPSSAARSSALAGADAFVLKPTFAGLYTTDKLNAAWWAACREVGLPLGRKNGGYVIHELRHTMVSEWIHAGEPEKAIMSLTGHKAVATLHRYGHTSAEAQRAAQERVAAWRARQLAAGSKVTPLQQAGGAGR